MTASKPVNLPKSVDFMVADMSGVPRGKVIDGTRFEDGELPHMANAVFFQAVTGEYGDATTRYNPKDEDILLAPDWDTYRPVPWRGEEHGQVICRALNKNRQPVPYDPRHALSMVLERYASRGLFPAMAPEVEFYLLEPSADWNAELRSARGRNPRMGGATDSFSIDGLDRFEEFVDELMRICEVARLEVTDVVTEMGPAQLELNFQHADAMSRADQLFLLKRAVRATAEDHGYVATFMAKPLEGMPGNGLHVHTSMLDASGRNVFTLEDGVAPPMLRHFISGLQRWLPVVFALIAPNVNSYKRFVPDSSAPINLHWGYDNRTAGIRVPYGKDNAGRVESRVAGADANPYLHFAATLAAGWLGLEQQVEPTSPFTGDAYELPADLPRDLWTALAALGASREVRSLLGDPLVDVFISVKQAELHHYRDTLSPWERRYLLDL
ncbi:MAG: glutamine synthetase [Pseudomonadales bacterium]|nr:glutamine synthetase [Pseudomonadales bacterium]